MQKRGKTREEKKKSDRKKSGFFPGLNPLEREGGRKKIALFRIELQKQPGENTGYLVSHSQTNFSLSEAFGKGSGCARLLDTIVIRDQDQLNL